MLDSGRRTLSDNGVAVLELMGFTACDPSDADVVFSQQRCVVGALIDGPPHDTAHLAGRSDSKRGWRLA